MLLDWTKHLKDQEDIKNFQNQVKSAKPVLDRLLVLLTAREDQIDRSELDIRSFDNPNWAYKQAFKNGCSSEIYALKKLISIDPQEN